MVTQITALLLSLAPLWSLSVALYRWPQTRRRLERRRRRSAALSLSLTRTHTQTTTGSVTDLIVPNPDFVPASADPPEYDTGKGGGKGEGDVTVGHIDATQTRTTALPAGERARPTRARALQSAMRGGRARSRSRSQDLRSRSQSRARRRTQTGSLLDAVAVPMSTAEEWNELATFGGASALGS